jgi:uncharacterized protein (TIGR03382 family)
MRPLLAALLLLLPSAGFAQSLVLTINGNPVARNADGCSTSVAGNWVGASLTAACTPLQVWISATNNCGAAPSTTNTPPDFVVDTTQTGELVNGTTTKSFTFSFNAMPSFATNACGANVDFTNYVCAGVTMKDGTGACSGTGVTAASIGVRYDNLRPPPPSVTITPLDSKLSVRLAATGSGTDVTDVQYFNTEYAVDPGDAGTPAWVEKGGNISANNPTVEISPLINGVVYLVRGYSVDEAGNKSVASDPVTGKPVVTYGFFDNYVADGGQETGGCGAVGGGPSALALGTLLLLALVRRRG